MPEAKQKDLLKCKTDDDIRAFARRNGLKYSRRGVEVTVGSWTCIMNRDTFSYIKQNSNMARQRDVLERLRTQDEILHWAHKNGVKLEAFSGGLHVEEWTILLDNKGNILSVERRLDEPREL